MTAKAQYDSNDSGQSTIMEPKHRSFGHISSTMLTHTNRKQGVRGLPNLGNTDFFCDSCKLEKFCSVSHKSTNRVRSSQPLELLFSDVWGPNRVVGRQGEKYFLSIIDDFSCRMSMYPMRLKSDAFDNVKLYITQAENFLGKRVKFFKSNNGREFFNDRFNDFFASKGIIPEITNLYTTDEN